MWNEIENRSVQAVIRTQRVITEKDFENAYVNRGKSNVEVLEGESAKGEQILALKKEDTLWYLQSRYDAGHAAKQWAKQLEEKLKSNSIIVVFGFADGSYIREALKYNKEAKFIVYEPCQEVFWQVFGRQEVAELLESENLYLIIGGINESLVFGYLESFVGYSNFKLVETCVLPNYDQLFQEAYRNLLDKHLFVVRQLIFSRNTELIFGREFLRNMLNLAKDVIEQYSVAQLENIVKRKELREMPAVLVSAGPSLDKNIDQLKKIKENVFIMAVDTALNTVLKHGIIPDMTITIDSHKPLVLFEDERVQNIPLAVSICANEQVIAKNKAKHFYELRNEEYLGMLYHQLGKDGRGLPTGGSVANNALALLVLLGFKTVIFMGQDLAYPGGVRHAFDAYHMEHPLVDGVRYYEVEDIYGEKVLTEENMELYLKWFESFIALTPEVRYVDATEGGAKIRGTEICTMKQMVEEFSGKVYDKAKIFEGIEPYLSEEEQSKIKEILIGIPERLDEVQKRIEEGLRDYDQMDKINRKSNGRSERLGKLLKRATALNEFMSEESVLALVRYYTIEVGYEVEGQVLLYDENAAMYEQIKGLIDNGRTLLKGYLEGIKQFRGDADIFLQNFT